MSTSQQAEVVAAKRTSVSTDQIRVALGQALEEQGMPSSSPVLDVLVAHVAHETANGRRMYNYNFGGIKGRAPDGSTAVYRTHERVNGRRVAMRDGFRAYTTIDDGARDYVSLLTRRYPEAMDAAAEGGPRAFAEALHRGRYFTDSPARYGRNLERLHGQLGGAPIGEVAAAPVIEATHLPFDVVGPARRGEVAHLSALPTLGVIRAIDAATSKAAHLAAEETKETEIDTISLKRRGAGPFPGTTGLKPGTRQDDGT